MARRSTRFECRDAFLVEIVFVFIFIFVFVEPRENVFVQRRLREKFRCLEDPVAFEILTGKLGADGGEGAWVFALREANHRFAADLSVFVIETTRQGFAYLGRVNVIVDPKTKSCPVADASDIVTRKRDEACDGFRT